MAITLKLKVSDKSASKSSPVLASLYADSESYDVIIIGADNDSGVGAHKLVLSAVSPVFKAMFTGQMQEPTARDIIYIRPVPFRRTVIKSLVEFVYLGEVSVDPNALVSLYAAADHYTIEGLTQACRECLKQKISINNCFQWYNASLQWGQLTEDLATNCLTFIAGHFSEALNSAHFTLLPYAAVLHLLQRSDLDVDEILVFEGVSRWIEGNAAAQTDQAKTLMENVRYPLISPGDLVRKVGPSEHKSLPDYLRAVEFHLFPVLNAVSVPQFLPRMQNPLVLPLKPLEVSCKSRASQVVLPPNSPSYCFKAKDPTAVVIAKNDCRFSLKGPSTPCGSVHGHDYTLKLTNVPTLGAVPGDYKLMQVPALSHSTDSSVSSRGHFIKSSRSDSSVSSRRHFSKSSRSDSSVSSINYSFAINGQGSSCVLSRGTADCTRIEHTFPVMVSIHISCACLSFTVGTD